VAIIGMPRASAAVVNLKREDVSPVGK